MRSVLAAALLCAALTGCTPDQNKAASDALSHAIQVSVEATCRVTPDLIDIGSALAAAQGGVAGAMAAGPIDIVAKKYALQICNAWTAKHTVTALTDDGCIATVNGVCIHMARTK